MTIHDNIRGNLNAIYKTEIELDLIHAEYNPSNGHCCPSCACPEFPDLVDKQRRRAETVIRLLEKRNAPGDAETVKRMKFLIGELH